MLTCSAQSFPTPSFRSVFFVCIFKKKHTLYYYSEPIGGSKPQISEDSQLKRLSRHENQIMAFVCPAQGFPQPSFRLKFVSSNNIEQCLELLFFKTTHHPSSSRVGKLVRPTLQYLLFSYKSRTHRQYNS